VADVHNPVVVVAAPIDTLRVEVEFRAALPPANEVDTLDEWRELELQHEQVLGAEDFDFILRIQDR
jgi:hypothetical protein